MLSDERAGGKTEEFHYEGGIRDFVAHVNESKDTVHKHVVYFEGESDDGQVEIAMQWNTSYVESVFSSRTTSTPRRAAHLSGFKAALTGTLNRYARDKGLLKEKEDNLEGEDVREGSAAVISVKLRNPQFEGQTKTKLGNPPIETLVKTTVNQKLAEFLEENPTDARQIITKASPPRAPGRRRARRASSPAEERARVELAPGEARGLPDLGPRGGGVFLVEGNSAGGSAVDARDRSFQAILPLRGKVINAEKNRINKVLSNEEIQAIITAIGTGIAEEFDISKLRYHRVIVMTDADVDGAHIRTLILTFLYRQMQELVEQGHVHRGPRSPREDRQPAALRREGVPARGDARPRAHQGHGRHRSLGRDAQAHRVRLRASTRAARVRRLGLASPRDFGPAAANFVVDHRWSRPKRDGGRAGARGPRANGFELVVLEADEDGTRVKIVERETGAAASVVVPERAARVTDLRQREQDLRTPRRDRRPAPVPDRVREAGAHADTFAQPPRRRSSWRRRASRSAGSRASARWMPRSSQTRR